MYEKLCYVSSGCNRTPNSCDWGKNGLICYGACYSIIIFHPQHPGTSKDVETLVGHKNRVNFVRWVRSRDNSPEREIVSTSADGTAIVWTLEEDKYKSTILQGHTKEVNIAGSLYFDNDKNSLMVVTASVDNSIKIWKRDKYGGEFSNTQTLILGHGLCLALSLSLIPDINSLLLAVATDNSKVQLYAEIYEDENTEFKLVETLKGHENWVRGLDFTTDDNGNLLLASCSQDSFIRIWSISSSEAKDITLSGLELLTSEKYKFMETQFKVTTKNDTKCYAVHLQSVLCGHEGWVYEVNWAPKVDNGDGTFRQPMKLLSSSLDKTMIIWVLDESSKLWMDSVRVGEVGGNTLGFYGSKFGPEDTSIIAHGYLGSFHLWRYSEKTKTWEPCVTIGGHFNEVVDVAWEPRGGFLVSISTDQTTRVHAPWVKSDNSISWHEIARPQVHGYDMSCLAVISRYKFISGAEEKILRVFKAPKNFVQNFRTISNLSSDKDGDQIMQSSSALPKGAAVPSLGLSNKAVFESSNEVKGEGSAKHNYPEESHFTEIDMKEPPTEENLLQNTLWPEVQKLYGHGYEVYALAASMDCRFVASACKATSAEHAVVIVWDTKNWQLKQKLVSHTLTVTQLAFSPDSTKLLSVSRDRRWSIFDRNPNTGDFSLQATTDKKTGIHTRIIWCCSWTHDSKYFVTGSRDGKVVVWWWNPEKDDACLIASYEAAGEPLDLKGESVTAVAFARVVVDGSYLMSMGYESGIIDVYKWKPNAWERCLHLDQSLAHHLTVKRLAFRPIIGEAGAFKRNDKILQLASASSDHSVKIHNIYFT